MQYTDLKTYIENIYNLEVSLYEQNALYWDIKRMIEKDKKWRPEELQPRLNYKEEDPLLLFKLPFVGFILFFFGSIWWAMGTHNDAVSTWKFWVLGGVIGLICGMLIHNSIKSDNKKIDQKNKETDKNNERYLEQVNDYRIFLRKREEILNAEMLFIQNSYRNTKNILDQYYKKNIIFPKYRNMIAISSFYEYFASGRCYSLEGHEGAYNIYENEIRQNIIISKLDEVIQSLEKIQRNQFMLYSAIQKSNENTEKLHNQMSVMADRLESIEGNNKIAAYNSQITAKNTEYLAWVQFLK